MEKLKIRSAAHHSEESTLRHELTSHAQECLIVPVSLVIASATRLPPPSSCKIQYDALFSFFYFLTRERVRN